jgi:hypothetical protein
VGQLFKNGMTPHEIYKALTEGPGSGKLDDGQAAALFLWKQEEKRADMIHKQAGLIQGAWQGAAGEGAYGAAQPLAAAAVEGADLLSQSDDLMSRQSGSFNRAKNSVVPVPPEPPQPDLMDFMTFMTDYEKEVTTYQTNAQNNIEVFRGYDGASEYNEVRMPTTFSTVSHSGGTVSVTGATTPGGGDFISVPDPEQQQQPRVGGASEPFAGRDDPGSVPTGGSPVSGPAVTQQPPQQTTPSTFTPPPVGTPSDVLPPGQRTPVGGPGPGGPVTGLPVSGFTSGGPVSTGGPGVRGGVPGGSGGPGSTGGPGATGRGPGAGIRGGALGPGMGVGALAAEEAAAQRAAASAAARGTGSGMMGGAPVGAGRGKGDEDEEHQRKVLIETNGESVFGSDVLTAPQVIGDDDYEDD